MPSRIRCRRYAGEADMRSGAFRKVKKGRPIRAAVVRAGEKAGETLPLILLRQQNARKRPVGFGDDPNPNAGGGGVR